MLIAPISLTCAIKTFFFFQNFRLQHAVKNFVTHYIVQNVCIFVITRIKITNQFGEKHKIRVLTGTYYRTKGKIQRREMADPTFNDVLCLIFF